ncbi:glycosyltransferase family 25 protein [Bradyrhizobium sp. Arg314]
MTELPEFSRARLFTAFGTVIFVDPATGELRHGAVESSPANAYFESVKNSPEGHRQGRLVCVADGSLEPIHCYSDICLTASQLRLQGRSDGATTLELIALERGLLTLRSNGHFLSAIPDGKVIHGASVCSTWELFIASENWCTDNSPGSALDGAWRHDETAFNRRHIASYIVHPLNRMKSARRPLAKKILFYGYPKWSHGRVYYDLSKHLHHRGYLSDILDWQQNHAEYARELFSYYDFVISALDGVSTLVGTYDVPYDKIIAISHHEFDMRMLIERLGIEVFEKFASYGVVSESLFAASVMRGIARQPKVVPLGVDTLSFRSNLPDRLTTVGYTTSFSVKTYGVEWKRGELAETAVREAGLIFKVAGSTANQISFHDMPDFYRSVDAVVSSSVNESGPLSVLEGAAAGRLVIGTPVGHFPLRAYQGAGLLAPIEPRKFVTFTSDALRYYKENSAAFVEKCGIAKESALKFDWVYFIGDWIQLIEQSDHTYSFDDYRLDHITTANVNLTIGVDKSDIAHNIHLINLDGSTGRLQRYMENNSHLSDNTVRVSAVDGMSIDKSELVADGIITADCPYGSGSLGCALSHIDLWKLAISENRPITIFEDDVYASLDFFKERDLLMSNATPDWDVIKWGFIFDPLFLWLDFGFSKAKLEFYERSANRYPTRFQGAHLSRSLVRIAHSFGLQAYSVTPKGARILLDNCLPLRKRTISFPGAGVTIEDTGIDCAMCAAYSSMQAFACIPPLVIPDPDQTSDRIRADNSP